MLQSTLQSGGTLTQALLLLSAGAVGAAFVIAVIVALKKRITRSGGRLITGILLLFW